MFAMDFESLDPIDSETKQCQACIVEHFEKSKLGAKMATKTINDHKFHSLAESFVKLVAKCRLSATSN